MRQRKYIFLVVLILVAAALGYFWYAFNSPGRAALVASGHPQYPPFMWQEGDKIVGVGPELLTMAFDKLGIKVESRAIGSWDKVVQDASSGKIDAVVALYMTDERKKALDYSVPFAKDPVAIFVKKDRTFPFKGWPDLIGKQGTTTIGDSYGQAFDGFIKNKLKVARFKAVEANFQELLKGRADYFIYAMYSGVFEARKAGVEDEIIYLKPFAATENWHMAVSKKSRFAKYVPEINKTIDQLVKDGTVDKLITKYMEYYEEHVLNRVQRLVNEGIVYYKKQGPKQTFTEIDDPAGRFIRGDLYLFVIDFNGECLSHGATPGLIGKNILDLADVDGKKFVKEFIKAAKTKGEGWVTYKWPYKPTGEIEPKISFIKRVDGQALFIGCGFYVAR